MQHFPLGASSFACSYTACNGYLLRVYTQSLQLSNRQNSHCFKRLKSFSDSSNLQILHYVTFSFLLNWMSMIVSFNSLPNIGKDSFSEFLMINCFFAGALTNFKISSFLGLNSMTWSYTFILWNLLTNSCIYFKCCFFIV